MLNLDNLRQCHRFNQPFTFALVEDPIQELVDAQTLTREFPTRGFEYCNHGSGRYCRRPLFLRGENQPYLAHQLGPKTLEIAEQLGSRQYHELLSKVMSIDLDGVQLEAWFWRYDFATQFVPHRDQESKLVTQIFCLNETWSAAAGGRLRILNSDHPEDVAYEITPHMRLSTIIKRSDSSWHLVTPISQDAPGSRNTITVHLHQPSY